MGSKDRLAEMVQGMTEAQAGPFLNIAQAYLLATRESEEKGRTEISNEMIKYLNTAVPQTTVSPSRSGASDTKGEWTDGSSRDTAARSSTGWTGLYQTQQNGAVAPPATPAPAYPAPAQQPAAAQPAASQSAFTMAPGAK